MTTTLQPDHEHPQYVTKTDLEAFEGLIINRIAEMEVRLVRDIQGASRWTIGLTLSIYALVLATILTVGVAAINILSKLP